MLYLLVEDDSVDISEKMTEEFETTKQTAAKGSKMVGIGPDSVDTCIRITFGEEYGPKLKRCGERGTSVMLWLPVIREEKSCEESHDCGRRSAGTDQY